MKFGKRLRDQIEVTLPEWKNKFLSYKELKKRLKTLSMSERLALSNQTTVAEENESTEIPIEKKNLHIAETTSEKSDKSNILIEDHFVRLLYHELEKFNNFFMEKEEEFVIRFHNLKERIEKLKSSCFDISDCEDCDDELNFVRKAVVSFHGEMILLENYSSLNYTGLVKILKKYDKRTGNLLRHPFIMNVLRQPFYTTELLSKLIKSCEEEMLFLFPISSGNDDNCQCTKTGTECLIPMSVPDLNHDQEQNQNQNPISESTTTEYSMVYKSAVAALKSLQEIRKTSKTPHPLATLDANSSICAALCNILTVKTEYNDKSHICQVNPKPTESTVASIPDASSPTNDMPLATEKIVSNKCCSGPCVKKSDCEDESVIVPALENAELHVELQTDISLSILESSSEALLVGAPVATSLESPKGETSEILPKKKSLIDS